MICKKRKRLYKEKFNEKDKSCFKLNIKKKNLHKFRWKNWSRNLADIKFKKDWLKINNAKTKRK